MTFNPHKITGHLKLRIHKLMLQLFLRDYRLLLRNQTRRYHFELYDFDTPLCPHFGRINKIYKRTQINEAIMKLDPESRRLFGLIVLGYKTAEIAKKMNIHVREVKNRSRDLRRQLTWILEQKHSGRTKP